MIGVDQCGGQPALMTIFVSKRWSSIFTSLVNSWRTTAVSGIIWLSHGTKLISFNWWHLSYNAIWICVCFVAVLYLAYIFPSFLTRWGAQLRLPRRWAENSLKAFNWSSSLRLSSLKVARCWVNETTERFWNSGQFECTYSVERGSRLSKSSTQQFQTIKPLEG